MSVVVLEGCDGAGKSTLAMQIRDHYGAEVVSVGPPNNPDKALVEYLELLLDCDEDGSNRIVFDRFHWGAQAYGPVFRGRKDLSVGEVRVIDRMLDSRGCLVVYCNPPFQCVRDTLADRRREKVLDPRGFEDSDDDMARVAAYFNEEFVGSTLAKMEYDYFRQAPQAVYHVIEQVLDWGKLWT